MTYTREQLKVPIAKLLDQDEVSDVFIIVDFIKAIYVLFGHPEKLLFDEKLMMEEAYWDLENNQTLKE